nr:hypothetical protein [Desulforamulus aquiferis]
MRAFAEKLKNLENQKATLESRYQEWLIKQQEQVISLDKIMEILTTYKEALNNDDPLVVKQVIERFVKKVMIKTDTIEVNLMVSVYTTGGGGPHVHQCTDNHYNPFCLYYSDLRPTSS